MLTEEQLSEAIIQITDQINNLQRILGEMRMQLHSKQTLDVFRKEDRYQPTISEKLRGKVPADPGMRPKEEHRVSWAEKIEEGEAADLKEYLDQQKAIKDSIAKVRKIRKRGYEGGPT